jgi:hypothetical protein
MDEVIGYTGKGKDPHFNPPPRGEEASLPFPREGKNCSIVCFDFMLK